MARRMKTEEFSMWRDRLDFSHEIWRDHGLHDDSSARQGSVRSFFQAYRGQMWQAVGLPNWGGFKASDLVVDPVYFEAINTLIAQLYARNPYVDVVSEDKNSQKRARNMERLTNHVLRKRALKIKRSVNFALLDAILSPFGVVRHGFTPRNERVTKDGKLIEFYDPAKPDFPWIRRWAPWEVRIDPLAERFDPNGDAKWAAFRSLHLMDDIKDNPGMIFREDLTPTRSLRDFSFRDVNRGGRPPAEADAEVVEVWTVYDKVRREWFQLAPEGSDKPLREPAPWPIPWDSLPFNILTFNEQADDPFGIPYAQTILPLCTELNKVMTMISVGAKSTRRIIGIIRSALEDGEDKKIFDLPLFQEFLLLNGGNIKEVMDQITIGGVPPGLPEYASFLRERVRSAVGVSEMDRANRINVETATEAAAVQAGSFTQRGRNLGPFEEFLSDTVSTFGLALQNTLQDGFVIPILGSEDAQSVFAPDPEGSDPFLEVGPAEIAGTFLYTVRPGSTAPRDPNQDAREEMALNKALMEEPLAPITNWPDRHVKTVRAFGRVPADAALNNDQAADVEADLNQRGLSRVGGVAGDNGAGGGGGRQGGGDTQTVERLLSEQGGG